MKLKPGTRQFKSTHSANAISLISLLIILSGIPSEARSQNDASGKGLILPKMSVEQRDGMNSPIEGTVIYNTDDKKPQFYNGTDWKYFDANNHFVGERFGGGIIFFIDSTGEHGLIVAPFDQISAEWGVFEKQVGAHSKIIGAGKSNTEAITKAHPTSKIAANICSDLELNNYSDWYLPSLEELKMIYQNINLKGLGNFENGTYWSSSETDFNNAWQMNFGTGFPIENNGKTTLRVRAVRDF